MTYRRESEKVIASGHPAERERIIRTCVNEATLEPQTLEVKISYRLPEAVMKGVVAGAGSRMRDQRSRVCGIMSPATGAIATDPGRSPSRNRLHLFAL